MHCKACTKSFPVLLCTAKLAPKHFPVLLCTTKLAQSRSQYYCVLQSLHKALPSTTVYYKACTNTFQYYCILQSSHKHVPVLLSSYCVLQSLHKVVPSTTLYYKDRTKSFPVLLCTTKLAPKHFPILLCLITVYGLKITCAIPSTGQLAFPFLQRPFGGIPLHTPILGTLNKHMHREPQPLHATALEVSQTAEAPSDEPQEFCRALLRFSV